jgi:hypothetical protein
MSIVDKATVDGCVSEVSDVIVTEFARAGDDSLVSDRDAVSAAQRESMLRAIHNAYAHQRYIFNCHSRGGLGGCDSAPAGRRGVCTASGGDVPPGLAPRPAAA